MIDKSIKGLDLGGYKPKVEVPNLINDLTDGNRVATNEQNIATLQGQVSTINSTLSNKADISSIPTFLTFSDTAVAQADWQSDSTYTDYGYKATITLSGATADMIPTVVFGGSEASSGNYLPVAESFAGGIYIWAKVNDAITIPTIILQKAGA